MSFFDEKKVKITNNLPIPWSFKDQNPYTKEVRIDDLEQTKEDETLGSGVDKRAIIQRSETRERQKEYAKEIVDNLKKKLSKQEEQVLDLLMEGLDYNDVASILHLPYVAIKNIMFRIRKKTERIIRFLRFRDIYS